MKIALVADMLTKFGGSQQVLLVLHEIYPDAPIYTLLYDQKGTKNKFKNCHVIESSLGKLPASLKTRPKFLLSKFPKAIEEFDFSDFDVVISSSDSFAHGIITKPKTRHICYCHTPMRYAWDWTNEYLTENKIGFDIKGIYIRKLLHDIRIWDRVAAFRVDKWLANSEYIQKRITKYYRADAEIVYPPIDLKEFKNNERPEDYYLIVSRLEPYKKVELAVKAFNLNGKQLKIIGVGSELQKLKKMAKPNIEFLGWQDDESKRKYLSSSRAFIFPMEEDFGITAVEAQAAGRPVIAYAKGGALESIISGKSGIFFENQTVESLNQAIDELEKNYTDFTPENCRKSAERFSKENFVKKIKQIVENNG